jgi:NAD(P)-dependent dehydrogenase (short-subunit alcohol dehydrogenase family)
MIFDRLSLKGKTAIVSGAGGGGIGTATSVILAEAGANIVAVDIQAERVKDTEEKVRALGRDCLGIVADLRKKSEVERVLAQSVKRFGAVHCLANVAGGMQAGQWGQLETYGDDTFDEVISLNLRYVFLISQAVAKQMIDKGIAGSIASVASVSGIAGAPYHGPYGAAKAGLMALTRTMAVEWGYYGIRVNALAPGSVKTPRAMAGAPMDMDDRAKGIIPIGRACQPDEIAAGLLYLLSPMASAVSGHTLVVDGGATAKFALSGQSNRYSPAAQVREAPRP